MCSKMEWEMRERKHYDGMCELIGKYVLEIRMLLIVLEMELEVDPAFEYTVALPSYALIVLGRLCVARLTTHYMAVTVCAWFWLA